MFINSVLPSNWKETAYARWVSLQCLVEQEYVDPIHFKERERAWCLYCDARDNLPAGTTWAKHQEYLDNFYQQKKDREIKRDKQCLTA